MPILLSDNTLHVVISYVTIIRDCFTELRNAAVYLMPRVSGYQQVRGGNRTPASVTDWYCLRCLCSGKDISRIKTQGGII